MLKRMLVLLEEQDMSRAAIEYGVHLASSGNITLSALSVVDIPSIEKSIGPVPMGASYYAQKEEEQRAEQEKRVLTKIEQEFKALCEKEGIHHTCMLREGKGEEIILDETKYHDMLIMGYETSIKFGPGRDTSLQRHLISHGINPTLLIPNTYHEINNILLCYDGSVQATKTIHEFVQFGIWKERDVTLLTVQKEKDKETGEYLLERMGEYMGACCNVRFKSVCLIGNPHQEILEYSEKENMDMLVMGAFGKHVIHNFFFGSTIDKFLKKANKPIFIYH
ncbi:universal stress protein [candidate division KSB1 bacterium]|nr:universal stress protein [candidate division KSB1 bacterium]